MKITKDYIILEKLNDVSSRVSREIGEIKSVRIPKASGIDQKNAKSSFNKKELEDFHASFLNTSESLGKSAKAYIEKNRV